MKRILFLLLISIFAIRSQSQDIDPAIHLQDGTIVDKKHVFLDGESPTFYLRTGQGKKLLWNLYTYTYDEFEGEKKLPLKSALGCDHFSFEITPELFPTESRYKVRKIQLPNDSSYYFRCYLELRLNGNLTDRTSFLLNVLPSRARVKSGAITGGSFNYDLYVAGYAPLAHLSVTFSCDRMEKPYLFGFFTDSFNLFQYPSWDDIRVTLIKVPDIEKIANNLYRLDHDSVDWGQFYRISPCNKYGRVEGDSVCTTDYIRDEKILKFIDEEHERLNKWLMGIDDITYDPLQISFSNNILLLSRREEDDYVVEIYSLDGTLIGRYIAATRIDLGSICKGIYIVKIKTRKRTITHKIYKS